jgi:hypothetical protein
MDVAMKTSTTGKSLLAIATLLLAAATVTSAQDIYKCTQAGQLAYMDHPCPGGKGELLHKADDTEIIDQFLRLDQQDKAKAYADAHHLDALYDDRLAAYQQGEAEKAQRQADEALAAKQREENTRQQALVNQLANSNQLEAQNNALRQQNAQYQQQLSQPAENYAPSYGGVLPPYAGRPREHHDGDHGHPAKPREPVFHPCKQLAGGRVQC